MVVAVECPGVVEICVEASGGVAAGGGEAEASC